MSCVPWGFLLPISSSYSVIGAWYGLRRNVYRDFYLLMPEMSNILVYLHIFRWLLVHFVTVFEFFLIVFSTFYAKENGENSSFLSRNMSRRWIVKSFRYAHDVEYIFESRSLIGAFMSCGVARHQWFVVGVESSVGKSYLPGTGDTMITKVVPPGRGSPLHSGVADPCDYPKCG